LADWPHNLNRAVFFQDMKRLNVLFLFFLGSFFLFFFSHHFSFREK